MILPALPATLAPPAPFPLIVAQSQRSEFVAPGVRRATYRLQTTDGPLVVSIVAVDTREPTIRFDSVVANERMISGGETVSSMARRTGAVAGVNADYFDIGNTNQPLNVVVQSGALLRTPSSRVALDIRTDGSVHYDSFAFSGTVQYGDTKVPLTSVNEWPPQGGAAFLSPAYGALRAAPGVTVAEIVPALSAHQASRVSGSYQVASVGDPSPGPVQSSLVAFGPAAKALFPLPSPGETLTVDAVTDPPLEGLRCAVGGGPLLLADGNVVDDANAPAPEERDRRLPVSGASSNASGELFLASVDGRQPALSIGLTRPQFAALMLSLGATNGMAFDSGGSATLVARVLGEPDVSVLNAPSDGAERPVADGLFVYSAAPAGPAAQLIVRPAAIVALPHSAIAVHAALVDASGHALGAIHLSGGDVLHAGGVSSNAIVRAAHLSASVPIDIVPRLSRLDISADARDPDGGALVHFGATGFDALQRPVELGNAVRWSADRGKFVAPGIYRAAARDARIVARAAGARAEVTLHVGRRRENVPLFDAAHAALWHVATVPDGAPAALSFAGPAPELSLGYDFTSGERAAYANGSFQLPGEPLELRLEIEGDRSGVGVRAAFVNRFGERRAYTLSRSIDWSGWQARTIVLPGELNPPVTLVALYVVDSLAGRATHAVGKLAFRNASVIVPGTP